MPIEPAAAGMLLGPGDPPPVGSRNLDGGSPFVLICDHAGNAVPEALGDLGIARAEFDRHIGIDIGALDVAQGLSERLDAPLLFQRYSRLVIDSNRRAHATDSIAVVADGTEVPGNRDLDEATRQARAAAIMMPYHAAITELLDRRAMAGRATILVSLHSFTPMLRARPAPRPWQVGLCWGADDRFSRLVLRALAAEGDLVVGANQPYRVDAAVDYSIPVHGEGRGLPYVEFEVRQDLIATPAAADAWAARLARVLEAARRGFAA